MDTYRTAATFGQQPSPATIAWKSLVDLSLTGERVTRVLKRLRRIRGLPTVIQADNGPELRGRVLDQWAYENGVRLQFIEPGKPIQKVHIEIFNARLREECPTSTPLSHSTTRVTRSKNGASSTIANVPTRVSVI
jgi:transposase InsO family protein